VGRCFVLSPWIQAGEVTLEEQKHSPPLTHIGLCRKRSHMLKKKPKSGKGWI